MHIIYGDYTMISSVQQSNIIISIIRWAIEID